MKGSVKIYEFVCPVCGKAKQVDKRNGLLTYCSKSCAAIARNSRREKIIKPINGECVYQPESIMCDRRNCSNCGWNPEVAKKRLERIMEGTNELVCRKMDEKIIRLDHRLRGLK